MSIQNRLLAAMPTSEYERLLPKLEEVELPFGMTIYERGDVIRHVYFPNSGVVSLLAIVGGSSTVAVGMIGREGMVGISASLGVKISAGGAIVSTKGTSMKLAVPDLEIALGVGSVLRSVVMRFADSMLAQVSRSAACYCFHPVEKRLALLLLTTSDKTGSQELRMTQKFKSTMLGVRREAVNRAIGSLRKNGAIDYYRGRVTIINRQSLESAACECYEVLRDEEKLFPASI